MDGIASRHEAIEGGTELAAVAALEYERVDRERELGVSVSDVGLDVGDVGAGAEHEADVRPPKRMRRDVDADRWQASAQAAPTGQSQPPLG
jgi:hypothetical protein